MRCRVRDGTGYGGAEGEGAGFYFFVIYLIMIKSATLLVVTPHILNQDGLLICTVLFPRGPSSVESGLKAHVFLNVFQIHGFDTTGDHH